MNNNVNVSIWFEGPKYSQNATEEETLDLHTVLPIKNVLTIGKGKFVSVPREEKYNKKRFKVQILELSETAGGLENYCKYVQNKLPGFNVSYDLDERYLMIEKK
ncbi:MAG: hypothetical protein VXZ40_02115 [Nanoarchaeota archaeon]|nr:hypothetical protein [Nanoarchaeota archaeon]